ncbi:MAG TPA: lectin-like protein [Polyangiaceae bacterium]|jgi:hypothetical protein|nr:lectin-like protein [Polyangiaceae bacterium]
MKKVSLLSFFLFVLLSLVGCSSAPQVETNDGGAVGTSHQAVTAQPDSSCKATNFGAHDYWVCSATKSWQAAETTCNSVGMHLSRVDTAAESDFVHGQIGADSWIGATDSTQEGKWLWVDGNTLFWNGNRPLSGAPVGGLYNHWAITEPNDLLGEDCGAILKSTGEWNDLACSLPRAFVCESSPATAGQPEAPDTACTQTTRNGETYWTCGNARSWTDARANCQSIGMDLVSIDDAAEAAFLAPKITRDTHIGVSDRDQEGTWRSGVTGTPEFCGVAGSGGATPYGGYSNWASGQPTRSNDCTSFDASNETYWACRNGTTWDVASAQCAGSNSRLARIDTAAENALVKSKISVDSWLGGNDLVKEAQWRWQDQVEFWNGGPTGARIAGRYTNWSSGEPNNLIDEDCLMMYAANGTWNDTICGAPIETPGFVCEGPTNSQYPDLNDCAYASSGGKWTAGQCSVTRAYICESMPQGANAKLEDIATTIRQNHRLGAPRVMGFDMKAGVTVTEPFIGREARLGLRTCLDSLQPHGAVVSLPKLGVEEAPYSQYYQGVRVYGRGYAVYRNPTTKAVGSVLGDVVPNLTMSVTPVVSQNAALATAIAAIGATASNFSPAPAGELVIYPKTQGKAAAWELAWLFVLQRNASDAGAEVAVSSVNGNVLGLATNVVRCTTSPLPAPYTQAAFTVDAFQQTLSGDPSQAIATFGTASNTALPTWLYASGLSLNSSNIFYNKPPIAMTCGGAVWPNVMQAPAGPIQYGATPTDEDVGSAMFLASQTALSTFGQLFQTTTGTSWAGFDGAGTARVNLNIVRGNGAGDQYDSGRDTIDFDANRQPSAGAALDLAGHEIGHGIQNRFAPLLSYPDIESRAVFEGFGDIMGSTVETVVRTGTAPATDAYCMFGDGTAAPAPGGSKQCLRDFVQPIASIQSTCRNNDTTLGPVRQGCPSAYNSADYCTSEVMCPLSGVATAPCCDPHVDATVLDHWFYLLTNGDSSVNATSCPYHVAPIAPAVLDASKVASQLLFDALRDKEYSAPQYPQIAEATIKEAETIFGVGSTQVQSVVDAWYAVNVRDDIVEGSAPTTTPPRGAKTVNPWITFSWRVPANETSWDFQLDNNSFAGPSALFEKQNITTVTTVNGQRTAYLALALPENTVSHFVWRVRPTPSSNVAWNDCSAVNWFDDTGPLSQPVITMSTVDSGGHLTPGESYVYFPTPAGLNPFPSIPITLQTPYLAVTSYKVQLSTQDVQCVTTAGVPEQSEPAVTATLTEGSHAVRFTGTQPNATYYANVQPIGPISITTGQPAIGPCTAFTIDSGSPTQAAPPAGLIPANGQRFGLYSPHLHDPTAPSGLAQLEWHWRANSWMASTRLDFHTRDATGACTAPIVLSRTVTTPSNCAGKELCEVVLTDDLFPTPYPGGYCWDATGIAANGSAGTAATQRFGYYVAFDGNRVPGVLSTSGTAGALPADVYGKDSYGKDVTLSWDLVPSAAGYHVKVWQFLAAYGTEQLGNPTTFDQTVNGGGTSSVVVPAAAGGKGRYCWELAPLIEDPANPGTIAASQPEVIAGTPICYTTGPSLPTITLDNPPPASGYTGDAVTGTIHFDFVPDQQFTLNNGTDWSFKPDSPNCVTFNQVYTDAVNCTKTFTVPAAEGKKVSMVLDVFNGTSHPATNQPTDKVQEVKQEIDFGTCGGSNEACCTGSKCDTANLSCNSQSTCTDCGSAAGKACCEGSKCGSNLVCGASNTCVACGAIGQTCCASNGCNTGLACVAGSCANPPPADLAVTIAATACGVGGSISGFVQNVGGQTAGHYTLFRTCDLQVQSQSFISNLAPGKFDRFMFQIDDCVNGGQVVVDMIDPNTGQIVQFGDGEALFSCL